MSLLFGLILGFVISEIIAGRKLQKRKQLIGSLRFKLGNGKILHIHHWTWCLALVILILLIGPEQFFILGLFLGGLIQGLTYKDSFQFIYE